MSQHYPKFVFASWKALLFLAVLAIYFSCVPDDEGLTAFTNEEGLPAGTSEELELSTRTIKDTFYVEMDENLFDSVKTLPLTYKIQNKSGFILLYKWQDWTYLPFKEAVSVILSYKFSEYDFRRVSSNDGMKIRGVLLIKLPACIATEDEAKIYGEQILYDLKDIQKPVTWTVINEGCLE